MPVLVSVCIPAYNHASYIGDTINSVLAQTFNDYELIIVDDASTDQTQKIIQQFSDRRIRSYRNKSNLGMIGNWNRCLDLARGKYFVILSSDDLYHPQFLEKGVNVAENYQEISFVHSGTYFIDSTGNFLGISDRPGPELQSGNELFLAYWTHKRMQTPVYFLTTLYRREELLSLGGYTTELKIANDAWAWLLISIDKMVGYVPEALAYYRMHASSEMGKMLYALGQVDERYQLADLIFSHPRVLSHPDLMEAQRFLPSSSVYRSMTDFRAMRRNGLSAGELWRFYRKDLMQIDRKAALHPWSIYYLALGLLPPSLLKKLREVKYGIKAAVTEPINKRSTSWIT